MKNLTIIGFGNIGQSLARGLEPFFNVTVTNRSNKSELAREIGVYYCKDQEESVKDADYIIFALHVNELMDVIGKLKGKVREGCVVMDTCTVKELPMKLMSQLGCKYMGTHPQFRKCVSIKGKTIIVCGDLDQYFCDVLESAGVRIERMDPKEHDRMSALMSVIHLVGLNLLEFFDEDDKKNLRSQVGKASKPALEMMDRMKENSLETYLEAQFSNPNAIEKRKEFIKALLKFDREMDRKASIFKSC